jgi:hypothetical protein
MSCELTGNRRSRTAAHEAGNRPAVISVPPSSPEPAGERADRYARGVQPHHGCAPFRLHRVQWVSVKARACMSCNRCDGYCVQRNRTATCANATSSRMRNQCRDSRQPCSNCSSRRAEATVESPAGSRPLLKRQESPLPWHEDDAPVFRSSNDSSTHNGRPANRLSRCINSSAGQATPLAGEAGVVSPPP